MAALNRELAKFLNVFYRRSGAVWDNGKYSSVHLPSEAEVLDKIVYTLLNPVAAGLVASPGDWPGLVTLPAGVPSPPQTGRGVLGLGGWVAART